MTAQPTPDLIGRVADPFWTSDDGAVIYARLDDGTVVCGPVPDDNSLVRGLTYRFIGQREMHPKHGPQFKFTAVVSVLPHDQLGVVTYLAAICPNVGKKRAQQLWEAYAGDAVVTLRNDPETVADRGIMSLDDAKEAAQALHDESAFEDVKLDMLSLLAGRGFQSTRVIRACLALWKHRAAERVRANPYLLMLRKMPSAGFKRCDKLYLHLGGNAAATKRQMLCGWYWLRTDSTGHTWFDVRDVSRVICDAVPAAAADRGMRALQLGKRAGWLTVRHVHDGPMRGTYVAEAKKAANEASVASDVRRLLGIDDAASWGERKSTAWPSVDDLPDLTDHQRVQLRAALTNRLGLLTGKPGTGKTFSLGRLVAAIVAVRGIGNVTVCAPTGKAAVRITQSLRAAGVHGLTARTIHSTLEIGRNGHDGDGWGFERNRRRPLEAEYVICDEGSMNDTDIMAALLAACGSRAHVLIVGDPNQLPPVGHGCPLRDLIAAGVPCGVLTDIHRNAGAIVRTCHAIADEKPWAPVVTLIGSCVLASNGALPSVARDAIDRDANYWHVEESDPSRAASLVELLATTAARVHGLENVAVLVPCHKGDLGRVALNRRLQTAFNATGTAAAHNPFRVNDPVICLRNHACLDAVNSRLEHYIANGETGVIRDVDEKSCVAEFREPPRMIRFNVSKKRPSDNDDDGQGEEDTGNPNGPSKVDFDLAYAITGHKSQGSEWSFVVVVADGSPGARRVASREWIYTVDSRASTLLVSVGKISDVHQMARRPALVRRRTFLREMVTAPAATEPTTEPTMETTKHGQA